MWWRRDEGGLQSLVAEIPPVEEEEEVAVLDLSGTSPTRCELQAPDVSKQGKTMYICYYDSSFCCYSKILLI